MELDYELSPDYEYYPNNFSSQDHPKGVFWKYGYRIKPGLAILHNGLPERSHYNDPYNIYVALTYIIMSLIDLGIQILCVWTVVKSKMLSKYVKWFLLTDAGTRIYADLLSLYDAECILSWSCVNPKGYPISWVFVNQVLSSIGAGQYYVPHFLAFGLSINRIFAVFFNGLYYSKVERLTIPYIILVFLLIDGFYLTLFGCVISPTTWGLFYAGYLYSPLTYGAFSMNFAYPFGTKLVTGIRFLAYLVVVISIILDTLTLWKIRKMNKATSNTKSKAELKLASMVIITHLFNLLIIVNYEINSSMVDTMEPLIAFFLSSPAFLFPIVTGLTISAFNYPFEKKKKQNRGINQGNPQERSSRNTGISTVTQNTQVTRID